MCHAVGRSHPACTPTDRQPQALEVGPHVLSTEDVCRHVALQLGISEARARDLIVKAALQDAMQTHQD